MNRFVLVLALVLATPAALACRQGPDLSADPTELRAALRAMVTSDSGLALVPDGRRDVVRSVYEGRDYSPLWLDDGATSRALELVEAICAAEGEGLHPWEYDLEGVRDALVALRERDATPQDVASLELRLSGLFVQYAGDLATGRHDPRELEQDWHIRTPKATIDSAIARALASESFEEARAALTPAQEGYAELAEALRHHREIAEQGGWPKLPAGDVVEIGQQDPRVAVLSRRLAATGDYSGERADSVYDRELAVAVAGFQARHGLAVDSVLGPNTLAALNVPVEQRIRQIELNLERMRWVPRDLGDRYIVVNIPDYYLHAYEQQQRVLDMRVVVGEEYDGATPVFADSMSYVVFRPYWNIPQSILKDEILPRAQEDASYLARNRYEIVKSVQDPEPVRLSNVDWSPGDGDFPYLVRQQPGGSNSLGLVKFMFPNQYAIYLHDTPADGLFDRTTRAYSHGCIRVEDPVRLAEWVFANDPAWTEPRIRRAMAADAEDNRTVSLEQKVPVYILYLTAFTRDGTVHFRDDLYGMDEQALRRIDESRGEAETETLCREIRELLKR